MCVIGFDVPFPCPHCKRWAEKGSWLELHEITGWYPPPLKRRPVTYGELALMTDKHPKELMALPMEELAELVKEFWRQNG